MAQDLGDAAQQRAVFRLLAQWLQRLAGLDLRRHDHRWLRPGQEPGRSANQRQQEDATKNNPQPVLLPECGRDLRMGRTEGRDVVAAGGLVAAANNGWAASNERQKGKVRRPKAEVRSPKSEVRSPNEDSRKVRRA